MFFLLFQHVYHEACIVPWLELHGTCPICRKSFVPDTPEDQQQRANNLTAAAANSIRSKSYSFYFYSLPI